MEELKYSPGSAWRRIKAMQALEDLPELEEKIEQGDLTLANVSQVQSFCDQQGKSTEEKKDILEQVTGLSKRETEAALAALAPLPPKPDFTRSLDGQKSELRVTLDADTMAALKQVKDLLSHSCGSYAEVITHLVKTGLQRLDPARKVRGEKAPTPAAPAKAAADLPPGDNPRPPIPAPIRREVWRRDGGRCTYVSSATGRVCGATDLVQFDHIVPWAKGGRHTVGNLRLRCACHNRLAAVQEFGEAKMARHAG